MSLDELARWPERACRDQPTDVFYPRGGSSYPQDTRGTVSPMDELVHSTPLPGEGRDVARRRVPSDEWHRDLAQLVALIVRAVGLARRGATTDQTTVAEEAA